MWTWSCPYRKEAQCHAKVRKERLPATESRPAIWRASFSSDQEHCDHSVRVSADGNEGKKAHKQGTKRKVGLWEREALHSPSKVKMPYKQARKELRDKGFTIDKDNNAAFQQAHRQAKADHFKSKSGYDVKDKNKIGALIDICEQHSYQHRSGSSEFGEGTTFVLDGWAVDPESQYIAVLVSTNKLLRNLYLQAKSGAPSYLAVDCTHRLVSKGHACIVLGTMDLQQRFHKIAYGMLSSKNQDAHEHCFDMLINAVNAQAIRENLPAVK